MNILASAVPMAPGSSAATEAEILHVTCELLSAISRKDWNAYSRLCHPALTCFEPEAAGHLVTGLHFHKYYFSANDGDMNPCPSTICSPKVHVLSPDAAVIAYVRLVQVAARPYKTQCFEETRVWRRSETGQWVNVHFHRTAVNDAK